MIIARIKTEGWMSKMFLHCYTDENEVILYMFFKILTGIVDIFHDKFFEFSDTAWTF